MKTTVEVTRRLYRETVIVDGERIHVVVVQPEDVACPRTIVLGHGAGGSHLVFHRQIEALSRRYRVVAWDQRGFGASTAATGRAGPRAAADDLLAIVDRVGGPHPVHLVGQSMSGWAVVQAALLEPTCVASIVLSGSVGGMLSPRTEQALDRFIDSMAATEPPVLGRSGALAPRFGNEDPAAVTLYQLIGLLPSPGVDAVRRIRQVRHQIADIAALETPMLFLTGEHDPIFAPREVAALAAEIPTAKALEIRGAGHSPYFERPAEFNDALQRFLTEVDGA